MKTIKPSGVDFGSNEGAKDSLDRYFFDAGIFSKLSNRRKSLVIGRKGVGKTAIAYHILDKSRTEYNEFASILSFREIPYSILESFQDSDYTESSRFVHLWKFIVLIELAKLVVKNETLAPAKEERLRAIIVCVSPSLESSAENYLKYTKSREFQLSLPKFDSGKVAESTEGEQVNLLDFIAALENELLSCADVTCKYTVILDELDDSYGRNETYQNMLISMFKSINDLNISFGRERTGLQVFAALRNDIYDSIAYSDKNKWDDSAVRVEWIPDPNERAFETDLFKMINLRIGASYEAEPNKDFNYWSMMFSDEYVYARLKPFQYILSRTFYRPRDVIQYCKCIQDANSNSLEEYGAEHILKAELTYSDWLKRELKDEIHVVLPEIMEVLDVLKQLESPNFYLNDVEGLLDKIDFKYKQSIREILSLLFDFSIIGEFDDDKDGSQKAPRFRFRNPDRKFDPEKKYAIHYGLRASLRFTPNDMRTRQNSTKPKRANKKRSRSKKNSINSIGNAWPKKKKN